MKNILIKIIEGILHLFFIFPIKKKRVMFSAYSGKQYSCNPKYITEEILNNNYDWEILWAFCDPKKFDLDPKIKKVKYKSLRYLYYEITSKVVVDNVESWSILPKRKGQFVINTWHGGGAYKGVGLNRRDASKETDGNMLNKNKRISLYLSSSTAFTEMTLRKSFNFKGAVLEVGMPRNDILIRNSSDLKNKIRKKIGIADGYRIVLFAPTFRHNQEYTYSLDYDKVLNAVREKFGGDWKFLVRGHYYLNKVESNMHLDDSFDVSTYPDMQELLLASDILITDYSSSIWDFALTNKPGFLFVPDVLNYQKERAFYTPIESWPYPYATTNESLCKLIIDYDKDKSVKKIKNHLKSLGNKETGIASKLAVQKMAEII